MRASASPPQARSPEGACSGELPLSARLEPWIRDLASEPARLDALLSEHGSPLNIHRLEPFDTNVGELRDAAAELGLELEIHFARKANKCLGFVERARSLGLGVDVASTEELEQTLASGVDPSRIIVTAAIKPDHLLRRCADLGVTVSIDNLDELRRLRREAVGAPRAAKIALRLTPGRLDPRRRRSRFGLDRQAMLEAAHEIDPGLELVGIHFHLDGYAAADRVATIGETIELADQLGERGHRLEFIDIGGGIPISYLEEETQWTHFWSEHRRALLGLRDPLTFAGHGLGLRATDDGELAGEPALYPYWQKPTRGQWLRELLAARAQVGGRGELVASALSERGLELRCEPGRSLLDGCGVTAARVEFRKPYERGSELIGLAMNRTQCRSGSDDFLLDPLLIRTGTGGDSRTERGPCTGYLVGAFCIERELLSWRLLRFPRGVEPGDIVVFPNTAGYQMHILESSSHQMPLARNLIGDPSGEYVRDPIDTIGS